MSDSFKELLQQKKAEAKALYEEGLKKFCEEKGMRYVVDYTDKIDNSYWDADYKERLKIDKAYREHIEKENKAEQERIRKEQEEIAKLERLENFQYKVPPRFRNADISLLNMGKQAQAIVDGASGLILGSNGPGKTFFVWAVAKEWVKKDERYEITKAQKLLSDIKLQKNPYDHIDSTFGKHLEHLVIDEIDKIFESKADYVYLNYLIDMRYEWMLQTVVVGNGDKESFISALGQSIFSRLVGDGGVFIQHNGEDRRLPSNKKGAN